MKQTPKSAFNHSAFESFMYKAGRLSATSDAKGMMMHLIKTGQSLAVLANTKVKKVVAPMIQATQPRLIQNPSGPGGTK